MSVPLVDFKSFKISDMKNKVINKYLEINIFKKDIQGGKSKANTLVLSQAQWT